MTPGPVSEGSTFRVLVKTGSLTTAMDYTITHFDPPHRVVFEGTSDSIHAIDDIRCTATGDGTRIEYMADINLTGAAGLVGHFIQLSGNSNYHLTVSGAVVRRSLFADQWESTEEKNQRLEDKISEDRPARRRNCELRIRILTRRKFAELLVRERTALNRFLLAITHLLAYYRA